MKLFKNKKILFVLSIFVIAIVTFIGISYSEELDNNAEVTPNSTLTYYLNVTYDGIDRNGVTSSDSTVSEVNSGYMDVTDKLPEGLIFEGFVTTSDGTFGAVQRGNENKSCLGRVVDDTNDASNTEGTWNNNHTEYTYHGLHYNASTRTVSFRVYQLQAGCKLTVGIITKTPMTVDNPDTDAIEKRRDFYNFASIIDNGSSQDSNTVHAYMGKDDLPMYDVNYVYEGTVPSDAPSAPLQNSYIQDSKVGIATSPSVEGYEFSGWETDDVTINNNSFTMPASDVVLTGSFEEKDKYNVIYSVNGEIPDGYVIPGTKEVYEGATVELDSLTSGSIVNGYRFKGWSSNDVTITDNNFVMPNHNVTVTGQFEEIKYKVTYAFYNTVTPPNASSILPSIEEYKPGVHVVLPVINNPNGYEFLGWNKEDNFVMPSEDITVYGEWKKVSGTFEPRITMEVLDIKDYYEIGEEVRFKITVTNPNNFQLHDVIVQENNNRVSFSNGNNYIIVSSSMSKIDNINANSSVSLIAVYTVLESDRDTITNEAEITGALANNDYELADKEYKATSSFDINPVVVVHHYLEGTTTKVHEDQLFNYQFDQAYATSAIASSELDDEYKDKYHVTTISVPDAIGIINKSYTEVTYYYAINTYDIHINVIGGVGTVTGNELVTYGSDSSEDITITPAKGYGISKIVVDGKEISITNNGNMKLNKFINVINNHTIEVMFTELDVETPITGKDNNLYIIIAIIIAAIAIPLIIIYRKKLKR